ncbi:MAG TPA: dihydrodipicolinate synthase family protein [Vicinamibacterales bacterium]|nr:dihydrodipicolinate synthase family protein [Acidobacteriota bacterium]HOC19853.1 dihydrodipicolinate synthase family protein [Vicinamibacterales bacterium]
MIPRPLTGIVPPLVTPMRGRDELDVPGLERLIEHVLDGGVSGLFVLGTTGEGPSLGYRLRRELVERTCRQVRGRVPVLVGITDTAFVESLALARFAADAGADALVAAPPYYLPGGQPELREYLRHLVRELPLPLFLYNMPSLAKVSFEIETVRYAMDDPRVAGLKDSSGDMAYFRDVAALLARRPGWSLLVGPEERLLEAIEAGGQGGVNGGANLFPALYVGLYEAFRAGDTARARRLHAQVVRVSESLYRIGRHPSAVIKGIKCALACLGICDDFMAEPFHRFRARERAVVEQRLAALQDEIAGALGR